MRAWLLYGYTGVYFLYLFLFPDRETEYVHWITLVLVPLAITLVSIRDKSISLLKGLHFVGLSKKTMLNGLLPAVMVGLAMGIFQLVFSKDSREIFLALQTPPGWIKLVKAFGLMLSTAGFTEEFFFRGVLLSATYQQTKSGVWAVLVSSFCFGMFHLPYSLARTDQNQLAELLQEVFLFPAIFGIIQGYAFVKYKNLLVPVIIHSIFNSFWAIRLFSSSVVDPMHN